MTLNIWRAHLRLHMRRGVCAPHIGLLVAHLLAYHARRQRKICWAYLTLIGRRYLVVVHLVKADTL